MLGIFVHKKGEGVVLPRPRPACLLSGALLQLCQHPFKLLRPGAGELHWAAGTGMEKAQARGVETLARQTRHRLPIAVHGVPQNGMADISQMDPDLVGTARLQSAAQVGDTGIPGQHLRNG